MSEIRDLQALISKFADERDWNKFHTPKNLAMAISGEAGELAAEFQWLTPQESIDLSKVQKDSVALEMADIAIYLFRMADVLNVDLKNAIKNKLAINEERFPSSK